ncbi:hypothetical protein IJT17_10535 [bacterium]|nr:hypothetical protein [bacterium]
MGINNNSINADSFQQHNNCSNQISRLEISAGILPTSVPRSCKTEEKRLAAKQIEGEDYETPAHLYARRHEAYQRLAGFLIAQNLRKNAC